MYFEYFSHIHFCKLFQLSYLIECIFGDFIFIWVYIHFSISFILLWKNYLLCMSAPRLPGLANSTSLIWSSYRSYKMWSKLFSISITFVLWIKTCSVDQWEPLSTPLYNYIICLHWNMCLCLLVYDNVMLIFKCHAIQQYDVRYISLISNL